jgi:hypothetical protein
MRKKPMKLGRQIINSKSSRKEIGCGFTSSPTIFTYALQDNYYIRKQRNYCTALPHD